MGACDAGAPHKRERIWIVAQSSSEGLERSEAGCIKGFRCRSERRREDVADAASGESWQQTERQRREDSCGGSQESSYVADASSQGQQRSQQRTPLLCEGNGTEAHGSTTQCRCSWWDIDPADLPDAQSKSLGTGQREKESQWIGRRRSGDSDSRPTQSRLGRVAHGVAHRVDRLKAIGNGQVPAVAALAWNTPPKIKVDTRSAERVA